MTEQRDGMRMWLCGDGDVMVADKGVCGHVVVHSSRDDGECDDRRTDADMF
tara:strand:- start:1711 stop:1863 length:153 start_codon:yes stop_codon:yes gene_type:complete